MIMKKTYLLVMVAVALAICSCTKVEVMRVQGEVLAVKEVPKTAGSFMLPITVAGEEGLIWKVRPISKWLHADERWTENAYNVVVNYDSNESSMTSRNFARVGYLAVETLDQFVVDTVVVKQRGLTPSLKLMDVVAEANETKCEIPFNSNLTDECRPNMKFEALDSWVESIKYLGNGTHLEVVFSENNAVERSTEIKVVFTDAWGDDHETKCLLTQKGLE
jgi:hypothetical protein